MVRLGVILPAPRGLPICSTSNSSSAPALANPTCEPAHVEQIVRSGAVPRLLGGSRRPTGGHADGLLARSRTSWPSTAPASAAGKSRWREHRRPVRWRLIGVASDARRRVLAELLDGRQALCELFADAADAIPPSKATAGASAQQLLDVGGARRVCGGRGGRGGGRGDAVPAVRCTDRHISPGSEVSREGWRHSDPASVSPQASRRARLHLPRWLSSRRQSRIARGCSRPAPCSPPGALRNANGARRESALVAHCLGDSESRTRTPPPPTSPHLLRLILSRSLPACRAGALRICSAVRRPRRRRPRSPRRRWRPHPRGLPAGTQHPPTPPRRSRRRPPTHCTLSHPSPNGVPRSRQCELTAARHCALEILHSLW